MATIDGNLKRLQDVNRERGAYEFVAYAISQGWIFAMDKNDHTVSLESIIKPFLASIIQESK